MYLTSTKLLKNENDKLFSWEDIFVPTGKVIAMTVVSAFVDKPTLDALIEELRKKNGRASMSDSICLKIFIDATASRFAQEKNQKTFIELNNIISKAYWENKTRQKKLFTQDSGVYLVSIKKTRLFHSKMILCKSRNMMRMVLGSVNFTQCAFNNNEEVAIVGDVELLDNKVSNAEKNNLFRKALEYEKILNKSITEIGHVDQDMNNQRRHHPSDVESYKASKHLANEYIPTDNNLYDYLMRGTLLYSRPVSFSEYFPLELPKSVLQKSLESDKATKSLIGKSDMKNSLSIVKLLTLSEDEGGANIKVDSKVEVKNMWRSLCVPTSFGFWCPPEQNENLKDEKRKNNEKEYYSSLLKAISENKDLLRHKFLNLIGAIKKKIKESEESSDTLQSVGIDADGKTEKIWKYADEYEAAKSWDAFVDGILAKREKLLKDCSEIIFEAPVPYLSEDVLARDQFLNSFIESIDRITKTSNAQGSGVVKNILKKHSRIINDARKELAN